MTITILLTMIGALTAFFPLTILRVIGRQCNQTVGCNLTPEAANHTKSTQINPPISESIMITTAITTYP